MRPVTWRRAVGLSIALVAAGCSHSGGPEVGTPAKPVDGPRSAQTGPSAASTSAPTDAVRLTRTLELDGVRVDVVIERPAAAQVDAVVLLHGTVSYDRLMLKAAHDTLDAFSAVLDRDDLLLVSVAYPEEGLLMGDNLAHAQAALRWVQRHAAAALGITIGKVFLAGHSQGGYLATRLNTLHTVDGVIANAPGPLDLVFRCELEETGRLESSPTCAGLARRYGPTTSDPDAYRARSLLSFTSGHRADILFVQGLEDSKIQMRSWPWFRQELEACTNCQDRTFLEVPGQGHPALFRSQEARRAVNAFLRAR